MIAIAAAGVICGGTQADASSRVQGWGFNRLGQVGDGTDVDRDVPTDVAAGLPSNVSAIAVGAGHVLALADGAVYAWGANSSDQLGAEGGSSSVPRSVPGLGSGVTSISAGRSHSLAIRNGAAYAWGFAAYGALGNGSTVPDSVATPTTPVNLGSSVTSVAAGYYFSLTVANGAAYGYGWNISGQVGNGNDTVDPVVPTPVIGMSTGVTAVAAGDDHSFAIKDGALYAWGDDGRGQTGLARLGSHTYVPEQVAGMSSGVTALAGGGLHSLIIKDGVVYATGDNQAGQLGKGELYPLRYTTPVVLVATDIGTMTAVAAGYASSYALNVEGDLYAWGDNSAGQLGIGKPDGMRLSPVRIGAPAGHVYTAISAGGSAAAAILSRPDATIDTTAIGNVLNAGSLSPEAPMIAGAVAIDPQIAGAPLLAIQLDLADAAQAAALIDNLNILYGDGTASAIVGGPFDVQLLLASTAGGPGFFNFDFTYVVAAGAIDPLGLPGQRAYASVPIIGLSVVAVPEPAALGLLAAATTGLFGRRRRRGR